jgi:hypothetical protein
MCPARTDRLPPRCNRRFSQDRIESYMEQQADVSASAIACGLRQVGFESRTDGSRGGLLERGRAVTGRPDSLLVGTAPPVARGHIRRRRRAARHRGGARRRVHHPRQPRPQRHSPGPRLSTAGRPVPGARHARRTRPVRPGRPRHRLTPAWVDTEERLDSEGRGLPLCGPQCAGLRRTPSGITARTPRRPPLPPSFLAGTHRGRRPRAQRYGRPGASRGAVATPTRLSHAASPRSTIPGRHSRSAANDQYGRTPICP